LQTCSQTLSTECWSVAFSANCLKYIFFLSNQCKTHNSFLWDRKILLASVFRELFPKELHHQLEQALNELR
jgi:hypothetical protein